MSGRLIIASNRLPVSVSETGNTLALSRSNGGLATALASLFTTDTSLWVGWTGMRRHLTKTELTSLNFPQYLAPINLTHDQIHHYYDGFANSIVWPLAHGLSPTAVFTPSQWEATKSVTEQFTRTITALLQPDDIIWIHDYHLLLLPGALRQMNVQSRIGFFLHTPVLPPSQLAHLPHAKELFSSMVQADVIGVQTSRDARRLRQILRTLTITPRGVIKAFPIGIDANEFTALTHSPEVKRVVARHKRALNGRASVFSLSRLDYTKGIPMQLHAFKQLLVNHPELHEKVVYRLNVAPSREAMIEYRDLKIAAETQAAAINAQFGSSTWQPVQYTYINMSPSEFTAWYEASDIHLNTPIADGMNLIAKEYIAGRTHPGVLVISSTMGAAKQLTDAIIVPPKNSKKISDALYTALTMPAEEKARRWHSLQHAVTSYQARDWARDFLKALRKKR